MQTVNNIKGKVCQILEEQSGTSANGNEWKKQIFVVSNFEGYEGAEQKFAFEVFGNSEKFSNIIQNVKEGAEVEVCYNIRTNEYKGKYYTSLQAWKVSSENTPEAIKQDEGEDDLPF